MTQMYRLHDATADRVFEPYGAVPFTEVFRPRRKIRMSIVFAGHEVQFEACPACEYVQAILPQQWTTW